MGYHTRPRPTYGRVTTPNPAGVAVDYHTPCGRRYGTGGSIRATRTARNAVPATTLPSSNGDPTGQPLRVAKTVSTVQTTPRLLSKIVKSSELFDYDRPLPGRGLILGRDDQRAAEGGCAADHDL